MKFETISRVAQAISPDAPMPELPKWDSACELPPPTLADRFSDLQPGISYLLLALLLVWFIHTLWRPRDADSPQRWRLLCLGFTGLGVSFIGQLVLPFAESAEPSFSASLIGLIAFCLGLSLISLLASFRRAVS